MNDRYKAFLLLAIFMLITMLFGVVISFLRGEITPAIWYSVFSVGFVALLFFALHKNQAIKVMLDNAPVVSSPAKLISKATQVSGNKYAVVTQYFISFDLTDGSKKNFNVDLSVFNTVVENDVGLLTFKEQGTYLVFLNFQRQS